MWSVEPVSLEKDEARRGNGFVVQVAEIETGAKSYWHFTKNMAESKHDLERQFLNYFKENSTVVLKNCYFIKSEYKRKSYQQGGLTSKASGFMILL